MTYDSKLLIIDIEGSSDNEIFKNVLDKNNMGYYYNLKRDYPKQSRWHYDGHWDIKENQEVGKNIYQHFKDISIF